MKKFIGRILGIISVLIFGYQQFCYADVVYPSSTETIFISFTYLLGFIRVIILLISAISFFSLKETVKNQKKILCLGNDTCNSWLNISIL